MRYLRLKPGAWDRAHHEDPGVCRSARNDVDDPGIAEVEDAYARRLIEQGLAEPLDVSFPAVRVRPGTMLPGNDLSNNRVLRVVDGVDVPSPMSFAHTEAELLLEQIATIRSEHLHIPEEEFRAWMRTQPEVAHLADAEILKPVPFIDRWTAIGLIRVGLATPVSAGRT